MSKFACLITGISGEIGASIAKTYLNEGFFVIGIDVKNPEHEFYSEFIQTDLYSLVVIDEIRIDFFDKVCDILEGLDLKVLINNAAVQIISEGEMSDVDNLIRSHIVNVAAPLLLYRFLFSRLKKSNGSLINVGSIHSKLTKKGFTLYAASKAALRSLTKSLAIENEGEVLVFSVEPAAIDTPMLREGFGDNRKALETLSSYHPAKKIGSPNDVASVIWYLSSSSNSFLHGTSIDLSGGISAVLHDPG